MNTLSKEKKINMFKRTTDQKSMLTLKMLFPIFGKAKNETKSKTKKKQQ